MTFTKRGIARRANFAKNKLLAEIKASFLKGEYKKIFGEGLLEPFSEKRLRESFSQHYFLGLEMPPVKVVRGHIMLGFFLFEMEENFLSAEEIFDLKRDGMLRELLTKGLDQETAIKRTLKKYPRKSGR